MAYVPTPVPTEGVTADYLFQELMRVSAELELAAEGRNMPVRAVAPVKPREGTLAIADGVNWNPGMGAGLYEYLGGAWLQRLSDSDITKSYLVGKLGYTPDVGPLFSVGGANLGSLVLPYNTFNIISGSTYFTEFYDTDNAFSPGSGKFSPTVPGHYLIGLDMCIGLASTNFVQPCIYKNGAAVASLPVAVPSNITYQSAIIVTSVYMNGGTDYVQMCLRQGNTGGTSVNMSDGAFRFWGHLVRRD